MPLDAEFLALMRAVEVAYAQLSRALQIRVEKWCTKLAEESVNEAWRRNRNAYAALLLRVVESGELAAPFDKLPTEGPLDTLPAHLTLSVKRHAARKPLSRNAAGGTAASDGAQRLPRRVWRDILGEHLLAPNSSSGATGSLPAAEPPPPLQPPSSSVLAAVGSTAGLPGDGTLPHHWHSVAARSTPTPLHGAVHSRRFSSSAAAPLRHTFPGAGPRSSPLSRTPPQAEGGGATPRHLPLTAAAGAVDWRAASVAAHQPSAAGAGVGAQNSGAAFLQQQQQSGPSVSRAPAAHSPSLLPPESTQHNNLGDPHHQHHSPLASTSPPGSNPSPAPGTPASLRAMAMAHDVAAALALSEEAARASQAALRERDEATARAGAAEAAARAAETRSTGAQLKIESLSEEVAALRMRLEAATAAAAAERGRHLEETRALIAGQQAEVDALKRLQALQLADMTWAVRARLQGGSGAPGAPLGQRIGAPLGRAGRQYVSSSGPEGGREQLRIDVFDDDALAVGARRGDRRIGAAEHAAFAAVGPRASASTGGRGAAPHAVAPSQYFSGGWGSETRVGQDSGATAATARRPSSEQLPGAPYSQSVGGIPAAAAATVVLSHGATSVRGALGAGAGIMGPWGHAAGPGLGGREAASRSRQRRALAAGGDDYAAADASGDGADAAGRPAAGAPRAPQSRAGSALAARSSAGIAAAAASSAAAPAAASAAALSLSAAASTPAVGDQHRPRTTAPSSVAVDREGSFPVAGAPAPAPPTTSREALARALISRARRALASSGSPPSGSPSHRAAPAAVAAVAALSPAPVLLASPPRRPDAAAPASSIAEGGPAAAVGCGSAAAAAPISRSMLVSPDSPSSPTEWLPQSDDEGGDEAPPSRRAAAPQNAAARRGAHHTSRPGPGGDDDASAAPSVSPRGEQGYRAVGGATDGVGARGGGLGPRRQRQERRWVVADASEGDPGYGALRQALQFRSTNTSGAAAAEGEEGTGLGAAQPTRVVTAAAASDDAPFSRLYGDGEEEEGAADDAPFHGAFPRRVGPSSAPSLYSDTSDVLADDSVVICSSVALGRGEEEGDAALRGSGDGSIGSGYGEPDIWGTGHHHQHETWETRDQGARGASAEAPHAASASLFMAPPSSQGGAGWGVHGAGAAGAAVAAATAAMQTDTRRALGAAQAEVRALGAAHTRRSSHALGGSGEAILGGHASLSSSRRRSSILEAAAAAPAPSHPVVSATAATASSEFVQAGATAAGGPPQANASREAGRAGTTTLPAAVPLQDAGGVPVKGQRRHAAAPPPSWGAPSTNSDAADADGRREPLPVPAVSAAHTSFTSSVDNEEGEWEGQLGAAEPPSSDAAVGLGKLQLAPGAAGNVNGNPGAPTRHSSAAAATQQTIDAPANSAMDLHSHYGAGSSKRSSAPWGDIPVAPLVIPVELAARLRAVGSG